MTGAGGKRGPVRVQVNFRAPRPEVDRWRAAAEQRGQEVGNWYRDASNWWAGVCELVDYDGVSPHEIVAEMRVALERAQRRRKR